MKFEIPVICNNCQSDKLVSVIEQHNTVTKCAECGSDDVHCEDIASIRRDFNLMLKDTFKSANDKRKKAEEFILNFTLSTVVWVAAAILIAKIFIRLFN